MGLISPAVRAALGLVQTCDRFGDLLRGGNVLVGERRARGLGWPSSGTGQARRRAFVVLWVFSEYSRARLCYIVQAAFLPVLRPWRVRLGVRPPAK